jgi:hypothetical protein
MDDMYLEDISDGDATSSPAARAALRRSGGYRSTRGSSKRGKAPLSANQVIAEIRSPASVMTSSPYGRAVPACADGR